MHMEKIILRLNPQLNLLGFVLTKYDSRKKMNQQVLEQLKKEFGEDKIFGTFIRTNIALATAQEQGVDIFSFNQNTNGARDYLELAKEFVQKTGP